MVYQKSKQKRERRRKLNHKTVLADISAMNNLTIRILQWLQMLLQNICRTEWAACFKIQKKQQVLKKKKKELTKLNFSITFLLTTSLNKREKSVGNLNTGDYSSLSHPLDNKVDALSILTLDKEHESHFCAIPSWHDNICAQLTCRMQNQKKPISETRNLLFSEHKRALFYPRQIFRLLLSISWWRTKITLLQIKALVGILFTTGTTCHACCSTAYMWVQCL